MRARSAVAASVRSAGLFSASTTHREHSSERLLLKLVTVPGASQQGA
jgi:hypothetical protein